MDARETAWSFSLEDCREKPSVVLADNRKELSVDFADCLELSETFNDVREDTSEVFADCREVPLPSDNFAL